MQIDRSNDPLRKRIFCPFGNSRHAKIPYRDFRKTVEFLRILRGCPSDAQSSSRSTFFGGVGCRSQRNYPSAMPGRKLRPYAQKPHYPNAEKRIAPAVSIPISQQGFYRKCVILRAWLFTCCNFNSRVSHHRIVLILKAYSSHQTLIAHAGKFKRNMVATSSRWK